MQFFFQSTAEYRDSDGSIVGDIATGDDGFWLAKRALDTGPETLK